MEIANGKELTQLGFYPLLLLRSLRAVSVATGIRGNMDMPTTVTMVGMGAEQLSSAVTDSKESFLLFRRQTHKLDSPENLLEFRHGKHPDPVDF